MSGAATLLAACESTKKQFDFSKKAPDEFAVVKRAPLEMPPNFNLEAPQPGVARPQELSATEMARDAVLGDAAAKKIAKENGVSQGEAVLLQKAGAVNASPAIRAQVDKETAEIIKQETPGIDTLKKMVGKDVQEPAKVVDPVAETERLRKNKAEGKPLSTGMTPSRED
ncbi:MAG: DUF3035 domain-containing protein [Micavibrio aeruginosavorus]|uniref:DUF3035 domain-containing protein n=1 Tax=Micavibrio aeruginosavorus TaxID=349221 RepID=A0A2W5PLA2_9BACT|nr:MAG: DUF3035 domain-containing protein [Micavibrio aeruginosavorus]